MTGPTFTSVLEINENILQNEVIKVTHKAKCGKAVGLDSIPYELLKHKNLQQLIQFFPALFWHGSNTDIMDKSNNSPYTLRKEKTPCSSKLQRN